MRSDDFLSWLLSTQNMETKSARDVASRYRRATRYVDAAGTGDRTVQEMVLMLTRNGEFRKLSPCVQSQLKRAVRLHGDFVASEQTPAP